MKILVIGRSGQVAQSLAERRPDAVQLAFAGRPSVNLMDHASLRQAVQNHRADVVINAAAYTAVDAAETDADTAWLQNAVAPGVIAQACAAAGSALIHLSTDYVFDGTLSRPYREDDSTNPQSVYGRSKAGGEAAVASAGARALTVRTAWVYSPFGRNFVRTIRRLCAERDHLTVVDDQHGNPTSALDCADALFSLASRADVWPASPQILHLAGTGDATWFDLAKEIAQLQITPPKVENIPTAQYPTPAKRPANSRLDCTRAHKEHGIKLPHWRESLPTVIRRLHANSER